jgi:Tfp pilus assembly protein PilO
MRAADRTVVLGLALIGLIIAFWLLVLSPKRDEAAELKDQVATLEQSVAAQEQLVATGEQARDNFDSHYQHLVVLGKAVPEDEDTSSLFVQLQHVAQRSGVEFDSIALSEAAPTTPVNLPAAEQTTADQPTEGQVAPAPAGQSETVSAPATEAAAATMPIGATVGPAGLPVMPYTINLRGSFFELADFLASVDRLVSSHHGHGVIDGRLITMDGFGLAGSEEGGFTTLDAGLAVTTYVTPAEQGLLAGATPTGPPPAVAAPPSTTSTSNTTTTPAP